MKKTLRIIFICLLPFFCSAQKSDTVNWRAGLAARKFAGFYLMNGASVEFSHPAIFHGRMQLGLTILSSSLGTALARNALPVHSAEIYGRLPFGTGKKFQPFIMLNAGYSKVFFPGSEFATLKSSSMLASAEFGCSFQLIKKLQLHTSLSYQLISGNGLKGAGFIYPVSFQLRLLYDLKNFR